MIPGGVYGIGLRGGDTNPFLAAVIFEEVKTFAKVGQVISFWRVIRAFSMLDGLKLCKLHLFGHFRPF